MCDWAVDFEWEEDRGARMNLDDPWGISRRGRFISVRPAEPQEREEYEADR
jgi:hypothetical protein